MNEYEHMNEWINEWEMNAPITTGFHYNTDK